MAYLGSPPASQFFAPGTDTFSGTGSQTAFTLSRNVATVNDIQVVVNNVVQQPSNYTVLNNILTFSPAPSAGTNNIYVRYLSTNLQTIAPQQGSVTPASLSTPNAVYWDTSGNVGVGTTSPSALFNVSNSSAKIRIGLDAINQYTDIYRDAPTGFTVYNAAQATPFRGHIWQLGGTEAMRIDSAGNVGIGVTSTSGYKFAVGGSGLKTQFISTDANSTYLYTDGNSFIGSVGAFQTSVVTNNIERFRVDSIGNALVVSAGGLGYGTGSGGTVTQATNKSTAVTLNKPTGQITTTADSVAASGEFAFAVNNSFVTANDTVVLSVSGTFTYTITSQGVAAGNFAVRIKNVTAGALAEAVKINFAIIKGATS